MDEIVSKDGTTIAYQRGGDGPPLILVHGTSGSLQRWRPILPALKARYTVYAMDRRGRGGSGDKLPYAIEREYEDIAALADAIGGRVHLLGHSYGAICSLGAASLTGSIRSLILYEPPIPVGDLALYPRGFAGRLQALIDEGKREEALQVFFTEAVGMPARDFTIFRTSPGWSARVAAAHTLPREMAAAEGWRLDPAACARLGVPALLLLGGDSPAFFKAAVAAVSRVLPSNRVEVMPGQQHVAIDTAPDEFARSALAFLAEVEAGG